MIRDILAELPKRFATDVATTDLLRQLRADEVISESEELGGGRKSARQAASSTIRKSYREGADPLGSLKATSVSLANLYRDNRRLANLTLYTGLAAAFACIGVVLWVIVNVVLSNRDTKLIEYASSVVPGLLSASLFFLHKFQQSRLDGIQNDILILNVAEGLLVLTERMEGEETRRKAFESVIDMISHLGGNSHETAG